MKILKILLKVIIVIIVLFLVVALFLPSEYKVERSIEINQPVEVVYNYVADFNNFYKWNPWTPFEPGHKVVVTGDSAAVGQKYFWEGKTIGSGEMVFTELKPYSLIKADIEFLTPQHGTGKVDFVFVPNGNSTKFSWSISGDADYLVGRYMGLMMDMILGKNFEDGAKTLKEKCEAM
ncbi:MAG: SRPBCC family protein [Ignavibacteriales bacterium]|nr:SRPBCC family protein [Ignavibacteriales bacterium]MBK7981066.1 SRPBCC family protein [Ignavibacteriota bacterium]